MYEYKYTGDIETQVIGYGVVKPNTSIVTDFPINHPLFVAVDTKEETVKEVKQGTKKRKVNAKI